MVEAKYITINNNDFLVTKEFDLNNEHYLLAINENNDDEITVLKVIKINGAEVANPISDEELNFVLNYISKGNN